VNPKDSLTFSQRDDEFRDESKNPTMVELDEEDDIRVER